MVWSGRLTETQKAMMTRVQRLALLSILRPYRSAPTHSLEVIAGVPPIDIFLEGEGIKARLRNMTQDRWDGLGKNPRIRGHRRGWTESVKKCFGKIPNTSYGSKELNWVRNCEVQEPTAHIHTDAVVHTECTGIAFAVVVGRATIHTYVEKTTKANNHISHIRALSRAIDWAGEAGLDCAITTPCRSAANGLFVTRTTDLETRAVMRLLQEVRRSTQVEIKWQSQPGRTQAMREASELAHGAERIMAPLPEHAIDQAGIKAKVAEYVLRNWRRRWEEANPKGRKFLDRPSLDRSKRVAALTHAQTTLLTQVITGHGPFKAHMWHWNQDRDPECDLCLEDDETSIHWWTECPALDEVRQEAKLQVKDELGSILHFFSQPTMREIMAENRSRIEDEW
jgi:hypothetical protein